MKQDYEWQDISEIKYFMLDYCRNEYVVLVQGEEDTHKELVFGVDDFPENVIRFCLVPYDDKDTPR